MEERREALNRLILFGEKINKIRNSSASPGNFDSLVSYLFKSFDNKGELSGTSKDVVSRYLEIGGSLREVYGLIENSIDQFFKDMRLITLYEGPEFRLSYYAMCRLNECHLTDGGLFFRVKEDSMGKPCSVRYRVLLPPNGDLFSAASIYRPIIGGDLFLSFTTRQDVLDRFKYSGLNEFLSEIREISGDASVILSESDKERTYSLLGKELPRTLKFSRVYNANSGNFMDISVLNI